MPSTPAPAPTSQEPTRVDIFTDGACSGNPGPGGWGAIIRTPNGAEKELTGSHPHTTNNRMELTAALEALKALTRPCTVVVHADSQYVVNGMTTWLPNWVRRGWRNAQGKPVENQDLWEELYSVAQRHKINWQWVRGHAGHAENERADQLAVAAIEKLTGRKRVR